MKKILVLCSRIPYPLVGGDKIRVYNNIKILSKKYDVDVLFLNNQKTDKTHIEELKKICNNVYNFDFSPVRFKLNTLMGFIKNIKPLQVNFYYFREVQNWINQNIHKYQMIYCNHVRTTEYVKKYTNIIKVVDFVDSIAMNYEKACLGSKGLWKIMYNIDRRRLKKYETNISNIFEKKIIISDIDKNYIVSNMGNSKIEVIGNFVKKIEHEIPLDSVEQNTICFLGKMDYEPNISAMKYFTSQILPKLNKVLDIKLYIVGAWPTEEIKRMSEDKSIIVTGFVNNPFEYLLQTELFVAPMISGSGIQNKILEAMNLGKCVITTKIGAEGLENITGNEIIICENSEDMAQKIIYYIENKEKAEEIGENAKNYIKNNLSEEIISNKLLTYIES